MAEGNEDETEVDEPERPAERTVRNIRRKPRSSNARNTEVFLTDSEERLFEKIYPLTLRHNRRAARFLTEEELAQSIGQLRRILHGLESEIDGDGE